MGLYQFLIIAYLFNLSFVTNKNAERHFFITSIFQHDKSLYIIIIISS